MFAHTHTYLNFIAQMTFQPESPCLACGDCLTKY